MGMSAKKIQPDAQRVSEEGKGVMWREGRKESADTKASVKPFPISP